MLILVQSGIVPIFRAFVLNPAFFYVSSFFCVLFFASYLLISSINSTYFGGYLSAGGIFFDVVFHGCPEYYHRFINTIIKSFDLVVFKILENVFQGVMAELWRLGSL